MVIDKETIIVESVYQYEDELVIPEKIIISKLLEKSPFIELYETLNEENQNRTITLDMYKKSIGKLYTVKSKELIHKDNKFVKKVQKFVTLSFRQLVNAEANIEISNMKKEKMKLIADMESAQKEVRETEHQLENLPI